MCRFWDLDTCVVISFYLDRKMAQSSSDTMPPLHFVIKIWLAGNVSDNSYLRILAIPKRSETAKVVWMFLVCLFFYKGQ